MPTYATITGRITIPGTEIGIRAEVTATPLTTDHVVIDTDRATWGPASAETDGAGNLTDLQVPTGVEPAGVLWRFTATPVDRRSSLQTWTIGDFEITASTTIQALAGNGVQVTAVDETMVENIGAAVAEAEGYAAAAATARDEAELVSGLTGEDAAVAALFSNPTSAARTQASTVYIAKGSFIFNVRDDYGAVGDGVTDDSGPLAAARAALVAKGGGTIHFPYTPNGYRAGAFVPVANMTVRGERRVMLKRIGASGNFFFNVPASVKDLSFEDLTIDSNGLSTSSTIRPATGARGVRVLNCAMQDSGRSTAAYLIDMQTDVADVTIDGCTFRNAPIPVSTGAVTFDAATDVVTSVGGAHGLVVGDVIQFGTITTTTGVTAGAYYFVKTVPTTTTFTIAAGANASPTIDLVSNGSGTGLALANGIVNAIRAAGTVSDLYVNKNVATGIRERFFYGSATATAACFDATVVENRVRGYIPGGSSRQPITFQGVNDTVFHTRVKVNRNVVVGAGLSYNDAFLLGTADQISMHRCRDFEVIGNDTTDGGDAGITIAMQCAEGVVSQNRSLRNDTNGVYLGSTSTTYLRHLSVTGNTCLDNGQARTVVRGNRYGIYSFKASDIAITGNVCSDTQATKTQQYGLAITDSQRITYPGNSLFGNAVAPVLLSGTNTELVP